MCGGVFGGGGGGYTAPEVQKVNPTATKVTPDSVANGTNQASENAKQKRRQGFASTQKATTDTLVGSAQTGGKTFLG